MKKQKIDYKTRCKEYEDMTKRLQAEFENFKKRVEKEQEGRTKYMCYCLANNLLPFVDSFAEAVKSNKSLVPLHEQLMKILNTEGITEIKAVGQKLNPYKHEVLLKDHDKSVADNIITQEIQKGYMLHDRVLRIAKVKVNDNQEDIKGRDTKTCK